MLCYHIRKNCWSAFTHLWVTRRSFGRSPMELIAPRKLGIGLRLCVGHLRRCSMLEQLQLRYFKCFEKLDLPLGPLTLLSGANASGKSTALQAIVLLHQTIYEHEWSTRLMLNGESLQLGTVLDVVDKVHGRRQFEIGLIEGAASIHWAFQGDRQEMSLGTAKVRLSDLEIDDPPALRHLLPPDRYESGARFVNRLRNLTYITA